MYSSRLEGHSLWAWTAAGVFAPMAWFLGSCSWVWSLVLGAAAGLLLVLGARTFDGTGFPRWLAAAELPFLVLILGLMAGLCADCWLGAENRTAFPVVLLTLGALSASQGCGAGARCGAVLFWFVGVMLVILCAFAVPEVNPGWIVPDRTRPDGWAALVLLLPGAALLLPRHRERTPRPWAEAEACGGAVISLVTYGLLSPDAARSTPGAFFHMARGISILGVAERLEALVAAALTLGWFCLMSLLLTAARHLAEQLRRGWGKRAVWIGAGLAWGLSALNLHPDGWLLAGIAVLGWYLLPMAVKG